MNDRVKSVVDYIVTEFKLEYNISQGFTYFHSKDMDTSITEYRIGEDYDEIEKISIITLEHIMHHDRLDIYPGYDFREDVDNYMRKTGKFIEIFRNKEINKILNN